MKCPKCGENLTFIACDHDMWVECKGRVYERLEIEYQDATRVNERPCGYRSIIPQMQSSWWKEIEKLAESCMCDTPEEGV
jgi:hypothetical protein